MSSILTNRGLSGREVVSSLNAGLGLTTSSHFSDLRAITMDNVHRCSLYELRQSLKARGHYGEEYDGPITFEMLLSKMVELLQGQKEEDDRHRLDRAEREKVKDAAVVDAETGQKETLQEKLAREKEERKAEALARSRERQAKAGGGAYFLGKALENEEARSGKDRKEKERLADIKGIEADDGGKVISKGGEEEEEEGTEAGGNKKDKDDPFQLKFRAKIGGKYA